MAEIEVEGGSVADQADELEREYVIEESLCDLLAHPESAMRLYQENVSLDMVWEEEKYARRVMEFVYGFIDEHKAAPAPEIVKDAFPEISFEAPRHPVGFTMVKVRERFARAEVDETLKLIARAAREDAVGASNLGAAKLAEIGRATMSRDWIVNPAEDYERFMSKYRQDVLAGRHRGHTFGWEQIDDALNGVHGLTFFLGRPKRFKSWMLLNSAHWAAMHGANVVFYSLEMTKEEMELRWLCLATNTSYRRAVRGELSKDEYERMTRIMEQVRESMQGRFEIASPDIAKRTVPGLQDLTESIGANVAYIDQFKFLSSHRAEKREARWQAAEYICEDLKLWANEMPIACAAQFNRQAASIAEMGQADQIGISDAIPQTADLLVGCHQTKDMKVNRMFEFGSVEARSAEGGAWLMGVEFYDGCEIEFIREKVDEDG